MKILTIYNTCGIHRNNTEWYSKCLRSVLDQDYSDNKIVMSSCVNSEACIRSIKEQFQDLVEVVYFPDRYIVNTTCNKTIQVMVEKYGEFDAYLFLDSGVYFTDPQSISKAVQSIKENNYSMLTLQTDTDTGFITIGYQDYSSVPQIVDQDFVFPMGHACNLHCQFFSNDIFKAFGNKIIPDVFAAFCTESTFPFLNAAVGKKWGILKDVMVPHNKAVDGPSSSQPHFSSSHNNTWNNLLYGRDARDFINDPEAISCGLGYEECAGVMMHNKSAYDGNENAIFPEKLKSAILKYFFTNESDLDYNNIDTIIF
jgi:hypothetical protein